MWRRNPLPPFLGEEGGKGGPQGLFQLHPVYRSILVWKMEAQTQRGGGGGGRKFPGSFPDTVIWGHVFGSMPPITGQQH